MCQGFLYRKWVTEPLTFAIDGSAKACQDYWWANILYINNLVLWKATEVCVGQTWYLSNDMQFYVIAPVFVVLLFWKPLAGLKLLMFSICYSGAITVFISCEVGRFDRICVWNQSCKLWLIVHVFWHNCRIIINYPSNELTFQG